MDKLINQEMFFLLAGPCVIEGEEMALNIAEHVKKVTDRLGIPYVFKGLFKKANRSPCWILSRGSGTRRH